MTVTGATYSFISLECVDKLKLEVSSVNESIVIDTPTNGSMNTSQVCLNCPLTIFDKDFGMDLVCLLLSHLEVILGMNCIEFNYTSTILTRLCCFSNLKRTQI